MQRDDFTPGMTVRAWTWGEEFREAIGTGQVVEPHGPLAASGNLVMVAMPAHNGYPAMEWWYRPEQLEAIPDDQRS